MNAGSQVLSHNLSAVSAKRQQNPCDMVSLTPTPQDWTRSHGFVKLAYVYHFRSWTTVFRVFSFILLCIDRGSWRRARNKRRILGGRGPTIVKGEMNLPFTFFHAVASWNFTAQFLGLYKVSCFEYLLFTSCTGS